MKTNYSESELWSNFLAIRDKSSRTTEPRLTQYNEWGQRVDKLETSEGWRELKAVAQREGLPGIFYERKFGEHSRIYGYAKVLLLVGDGQMVGNRFIS